MTGELVRRAEAAGAEAIALTVDAPGLGTRERDMRNRFTLPEGLTVANVTPLGKGHLPEVRGSGLAAYVRDNFKSDMGFKDLDWLCGWTRLPVVVKGICRGDDARRAAEHGAKAVVVSNHGGRQLDSAPATCDALPYVVDAVSGLCEVYVDGGIRRGRDVLESDCARRTRGVGRPTDLMGPVRWRRRRRDQCFGNSPTRVGRSDVVVRLREDQRHRTRVATTVEGRAGKADGERTLSTLNAEPPTTRDPTLKAKLKDLTLKSIEQKHSVVYDSDVICDAHASSPVSLLASTGRLQ